MEIDHVVRHDQRERVGAGQPGLLKGPLVQPDRADDLDVAQFVEVRHVGPQLRRHYHGDSNRIARIGQFLRERIDERVRATDHEVGAGVAVPLAHPGHQ
jgi:hypothetical protein